MTLVFTPLPIAHSPLPIALLFPMRYLAIDLGDKRTGLALGDSITRIATPHEVLEIAITNNDGVALLDALLRAIIDAVGRPNADTTLVFGLPINMDDTEGPAAKKVRASRPGSRAPGRLGTVAARNEPRIFQGWSRKSPAERIGRRGRP